MNVVSDGKGIQNIKVNMDNKSANSSESASSTGEDYEIVPMELQNQSKSNDQLKTCSEKEIVNRYMAMTSVRAFNFLSKDDPSSTNPSYSISKASS